MLETLKNAAKIGSIVLSAVVVAMDIAGVFTKNGSVKANDVEPAES